MTTTIQRLARWASVLDASEIPPCVLERARLQQIHLAGIVQHLHDRPLAAALRENPLRMRAALAAWLELDDALLGGRTGIGAVPAAWHLSAGQKLGALDVAIVAGNEVGGRLGLSALLGPDLVGADPAVAAVASATAAGRLLGLSAGQLAHAIALSIGSTTPIPAHAFLDGGDAVAIQLGQAVYWGAESARLAAAGMQGDLTLLEPQSAFLEARSWVVLHSAFTGLGSSWLTDTLSFKHTPGPLAAQVSVQAVHEILRRHVKAADKRLRVDQIERIEIQTGALGVALSRSQPRRTPAGVVRSARDLIGILAVAYELGPEQLDADWLQQKGDSIQFVAERVTIRHEEEWTVGLVEQLIGVALPLFSGLRWRQLAQVAAQACASWQRPSWGWRGLLALLRSRPDQLRDRLLDSSADLADARLEEFQFRFDTEVKLFTTRGGSWPERRAVPEGSPGWSWGDTVQRSLSRLPGRQGERAMRASRSEVATDWVGELLATSLR